MAPMSQMFAAFGPLFAKILNPTNRTNTWWRTIGKDTQSDLWDCGLIPQPEIIPQKAR